MVAMSGGVDSSVSAAILHNQGLEVEGVTLKLFDFKKIGLNIDNKDITDAQDVAKLLNIEHSVVNLEHLFEEQVINKFVEGYLNGITPNPCIFCNKHVKFGALLDYAKSHGCSKLATGHYALIEHDSASKRFLIKRPTDSHKDQTYVLCFLTQEQLSYVVFPLAGTTKQETRKLAQHLGFSIFNKPESQDICFVKGGKYIDFIKHYTKLQNNPGNFVNAAGQVIGTHKGIINYTIGQRRWLGVSFGKPMYVIAKNSATNTVVLGEENELFKKRLIAQSVNFIPFTSLNGTMEVDAKIRYNHAGSPATISMLNANEVLVEFKTPQKSITPGQTVAFYKDEYLVGGGIII